MHYKTEPQVGMHVMPGTEERFLWTRKVSTLYLPPSLRLSGQHSIPPSLSASFWSALYTPPPCLRLSGQHSIPPSLSASFWSALYNSILVCVFLVSSLYPPPCLRLSGQHSIPPSLSASFWSALYNSILVCVFLVSTL